ncbi:MAG: aldo/keto reductase [Proteobacteria bacterium]|nr:aldo/keto reductase [Pseudomonadota bacterium]MBU1452406.1 aldo/keto reductase [Pseudomonadota bacterium]MBU2467673.1 aldo/keto reductase [Pseudomonadota bacterium]MBU2518225.1 aldo/keto reductase [Pseudomonadota bacterium]
MKLHNIPFGNSGDLITQVGLGGEGVLRTTDRWPEARAVISEALTQSITYYDSAVAYAGSQGYYGRLWRERPQERARVFQTSKSAQRTREGAWAELQASLATLGVGHLDLWQIHDLREPREFEAIAGPGGALEAFVQAREQGLARHIGVTGHHDPQLLTQAVLSWPLDAVLLPVNPVEACLDGFLNQTLPAAREKGLAVIAMKVLGAGHYLAPEAEADAISLIRFALAQPVTTVIVGCANPSQVKALAQAGELGPLPPEEQKRLKELYRPQARRLAFYRGRI